MTKPDERVTRYDTMCGFPGVKPQNEHDRETARANAKAAERAKILERARRTGRKTVLSRLSTKAAATKPFLGLS